jgi:adenylate cyclase
VGTILIYNVVSVIAVLPYQILVINDFFLFSTAVVGFSATYLLEKQVRTEFLLSKELDLVTDKLDSLVRDIFPERIANRLRAGEQIIAESHGEASVLFADLAGFTTLAKRVSPGHLLEILNEIFTKLDELTEHHGVEKIKTIGDAYMVVSGVSSHEQDSVEKLAEFALDVRSSIEKHAVDIGYPLAIRIGIATGQVISGVIGFKRLSFDLWGETVNLASRIESITDVGTILVSEPTYWRLRAKYDFEERRMVHVKDLGEVPAYFLISKKSAAETG